MVLIRLRERKAKTKTATPVASAWHVAPVRPKVKRREVEKKLEERAAEPTFRAERKKMQETTDLRQVADSVEDVATLLEWRAQEHGYAPRSARWFITLAALVAAAAGTMVLLSNVLGAIVVGIIGVLIYALAQREPDEVRYRIMVDGVAINNRLYLYRELQAFNIVYVPGQVKTVLLRSTRRFSPLVQLELGQADPLPIRDQLLEFLPEDADLEEPIVDVIGRRFGL